MRRRRRAAGGPDDLPARTGFVRLKVKEGTRWEWARVPVRAWPYLDGIPRAPDRSGTGSPPQGPSSGSGWPPRDASRPLLRNAAPAGRGMGAGGAVADC